MIARMRAKCENDGAEVLIHIYLTKIYFMRYYIAHKYYLAKFCFMRYDISFTRYLSKS